MIHATPNCLRSRTAAGAASVGHRTTTWIAVPASDGSQPLAAAATTRWNFMPKPVRDPEKARRAARHPDRPGEECRAAKGTAKPVIDRSRCEGKNDCVDVCPEDVFEVRRIDDADFAALGFLAKMKSLAHRRLTAYTPNADACRSCGLCVVACPEKAIELVPA
jgi:NAD-dependent dihydropyrimidine dehydrogenase PreA subunit